MIHGRTHHSRRNVIAKANLCKATSNPLSRFRKRWWITQQVTMEAWISRMRRTHPRPPRRQCAGMAGEWLDENHTKKLKNFGGSGTYPASDVLCGNCDCKDQFDAHPILDSRKFSIFSENLLNPIRNRRRILE
jgi:hypothetical protein